MNSFSKLALLATLFTVPFAGLAMDDGMDFNFFNSVETPAQVTVQATTQVAEATVEVTEKVAKGVIALAQENPAIAAGIAVTTAVVFWGVKRLAFGANKTTVTQTETQPVNPQTEQKPAKLNGLKAIAAEHAKK